MSVRACVCGVVAPFVLQAMSLAQVNDSTPGYFAFPMSPLDASPSFIDMSFLNPEPAGAAGPVTVRDGHFYDGRGKRLRLLGSNVCFVGAFPSKEDAVLTAARLRKLGMNVMRLHHMDEDVTPRGLWNADHTDFDPQQVDRLDWFVHQLKQHGIYINLNLHVKRGYEGMPEGLPRAFRFGKGVDYFYRPFIESQKEYARKLLLRRNPYTGLTYAEDPAVVAVEINNENALTDKSWDELRQLKEPIRSEFNRQWTQWLLKRHGSADAVHAAWDDGRDAGVSAVFEAPPPQNATHKQKRDFYSFLVETERNYINEMRRFLRDELGVTAPMCGTQISYGEVQGIYREALTSDYADYHTYFGHPQFPPGESWNLGGDWRIGNNTLVAAEAGGALTRAAMYRVQGMPYVLSELDHPFPNNYVAEMYPMWASFAALQDWDGIYQFNYQNRPVDPEQPWVTHYFELLAHPGKLVFHPVAAVMFRMGAVAPADAMAVADIPVGDKLMHRLAASGKHLGSETAPVLRALSRTQRVGLQISDRVNKITPPDTAADASSLTVSETGQITWDQREPGREYYAVNAPAVRSVAGYIAGRTVTLGDVSVTVHEARNGWASVAVAALDGRPVAESARVLVVVAGNVENSNMHWNEDRTGVRSVPDVEPHPAGLVAHWGEPPIVAEAVVATITLPGGHVRALDTTGSPAADVPVQRTGDGVSFTTDAKYQTLWYGVTPSDAAP